MKNSNCQFIIVILTVLLSVFIYCLKVDKDSSFKYILYGSDYRYRITVYHKSLLSLKEKFYVSDYHYDRYFNTLMFLYHGKQYTFINESFKIEKLK